MLALVTCHEARDVDTDLPLLQRELPEAVLVDWDDATVDWGSYAAVVLRSPWDYHRRRDEFLTWATSVAGESELWNPLPVVVWNTDKHYLAELAARGIPIVPTEFLSDHSAVERRAAAGGFRGDVVVKPTVGVSASGVLATSDEGEAVDHARSLLAAGLTPMIQPYLAEVERTGETGLVYLGGRFSHAFRRRVVLPHGGRLDGDLLGEERSVARRATRSECEVGDAVMAVLPETAYARIDLLPTADGPRVLEVELTEPSLFLHLDDGAAARAAAVFRSLMG